MPKILIENREAPVLLEIVKTQGNKIIARGEFGRPDVPTQNGRIYPTKLMEREIKKLGESISARKVLGELDHPPDGKTSYKRVSHVITDLRIKDGIIIGEAEILNTREGIQLKALIEGGIPLGISSRGFGSTTPVQGKVEGEMVQDDFILKTYDFVPDPAVQTATPEIFTESIDDPTAARMFLDEFPDIAKEIMEAARDGNLNEKEVSDKIEAAKEDAKKELQEKFEKQLAKALIDTKSDVSTALREEFSKDPQIGAARAVLAQVAEMVSAYNATPDEKTVRDALKAKDLEVAEAIDQRDQASRMAQLAAWRLFVEREAKEHPMFDTIVKLVNVEDCKSLSEVKERLGVVIADLPEPVEQPEVEEGVSEEEASLREENARLEGQLTLLTSKVDELKDKLQKAVKLAERIDEQHNVALRRAEDAEVERDKALEEMNEAKEHLDLEVYKHEKVGGMVNGRKLLSLLEGVNSKETVDKLVASDGLTSIPDGELSEFRRHLRRGHGEPAELTEDKGKRGGRGKTIDELGNDMAQMRVLAGIDKEQAS